MGLDRKHLPEKIAKEEEDFALVILAGEADMLTKLLPELGELHKTLRDIGHTAHLGTVEDTIGYISGRLHASWDEYMQNIGLGDIAVKYDQIDSPPS